MIMKSLNSDVTSGGTEVTRFNALRHGVLSRYTVLPWEDEAEYRELLEAFVAEHNSHGPTEEHLVEELAGIVWRKRRLRLAEAATHRHALAKTLGPHRGTVKAALVHIDTSDPERVVDAIRATAAGTDEERADIAADRAMTRRALDILDGSGGNLYAAAFAELRDDTLEWWAETLARAPEYIADDDEQATTDGVGLHRFIEAEVLPWFEARERDLSHRPLIQEQAFGEALDPDKLDRLGRYEVHLDRKFERTLAMLLKLKDLRRPTLPH